MTAVISYQIALFRRLPRHKRHGSMPERAEQVRVMLTKRAADH